MDNVEVQRAFIDKMYENIEKSTYGENPFHKYFRDIPFKRLQNLRFFWEKCFNSRMWKRSRHTLLKKHFDAAYFVTDISANAVETAKISNGVDGKMEYTEDLSFKIIHLIAVLLVTFFIIFKYTQKGCTNY